MYSKSKYQNSYHREPVKATVTLPLGLNFPLNSVVAPLDPPGTSSMASSVAAVLTDSGGVGSAFWHKIRFISYLIKGNVWVYTTE